MFFLHISPDKVALQQHGRLSADRQHAAGQRCKALPPAFFTQILLVEIYHVLSGGLLGKLVGEKWAVFAD